MKWVWPSGATLQVCFHVLWKSWKGDRDQGESLLTQLTLLFISCAASIANPSTASFCCLTQKHRLQVTQQAFLRLSSLGFIVKLALIIEIWLRSLASKAKLTLSMYWCNNQKDCDLCLRVPDRKKKKFFVQIQLLFFCWYICIITSHAAKKKKKHRWEMSEINYKVLAQNKTGNRQTFNQTVGWVTVSLLCVKTRLCVLCFVSEADLPWKYTEHGSDAERKGGGAF